MEKNFSVLLDTPLFSGISPQELTALFSCLDAATRTFSKGAFIFRAGEPVNFMGAVLSGGVQIMQEDVLGNRVILSKLGPGDLFGEVFSCAQLKRLPVSVQAAAESEILFLDYHRVVATCPSACSFHHRLVQNMLCVLARKNIILQQKIAHMSKRSTRAKLLSYLLAQAQQAGSLTFTIPYNRQELADYLCVERSAMSAELGRMQEDGILRFHRNEFVLLRTEEDDAL